MICKVVLLSAILYTGVSVCVCVCVLQAFFIIVGMTVIAPAHICCSFHPSFQSRDMKKHLVTHITGLRDIKQ